MRPPRRSGCSSSPLPQPDAEIAETIWRAVRDNHVLRIRYIDVGGLETEREVEPQHVVVGPNGSYLTAWCHLRGDDRVFRMDRITRAERTRRCRARSASSRSRSSTATRPSCRQSGAAPRRTSAKHRHRAVARPRHGGCSPPTRRVNRRQKETPMTNPAPGTLAWFEVATATPTAPRSSTAACSTGPSRPTARRPPAAWTTATSRPPAPTDRWAASSAPAVRCPTTPCSTSWSPTSRPPAPTPSSSAARW